MMYNWESFNLLVQPWKSEGLTGSYFDEDSSLAQLFNASSVWDINTAYSKASDLRCRWTVDRWHLFHIYYAFSPSPPFTDVQTHTACGPHSARLTAQHVSLVSRIVSNISVTVWSTGYHTVQYSTREITIYSLVNPSMTCTTALLGNLT